MISNSYASTLNESISQDNIKKTICIPNYTQTIRPPSSYTNKIKLVKLKSIGLSKTDAKKYVLDHIIPLSSGGNPNDPENLILQPFIESKLKDRLEVKIHKDICDGKISLQYGQKIFENNWKDAYQIYYGEIK